MWNNVGILRTEEELLSAKTTISKLFNDFDRNRKCLNKDEYEYRNMLTVADLIINSALNRKESRGAHSRADYKDISNDAKHSILVKDSKMELVYA